jgi:hypothetical protein
MRLWNSALSDKEVAMHYDCHHVNKGKPCKDLIKHSPPYQCIIYSIIWWVRRRQEGTRARSGAAQLAAGLVRQVQSIAGVLSCAISVLPPSRCRSRMTANCGAWCTGTASSMAIRTKTPGTRQDYPARAHYVKIEPQTWRIRMRSGVLICECPCVGGYLYKLQV